MDTMLKKAKVIYVGDSFQDSDLRFQREDKEKKQKNVLFVPCEAFVWLSQSDFHIHQLSLSPNGRCIIAVRSQQRGLFVIVCCLHNAAIQMCYLVRINDRATQRRKWNINNFLHK